MKQKDLKKYREQRRIKQFEVANKLGIHVQYLSKVENCHVPASDQLIEKYLKAVESLMVVIK